MSPEEPVLKTVQEARIAFKILTLLDGKQQKFGKEKSWLYIWEVMNELKGLKSMTIRSFIEKLEKRKIIEFIPPIKWGGAFRYTVQGRELIKKELSELTEMSTSRILI